MSRFNLSAIFAAHQRQSLAVNISASMAAVLLLTLISVIAFILIRGSAFFWPMDVFTIRYMDPNLQRISQAFAQVRDESVRAPTLQRLEDDSLSFVDKQTEQNWILSKVSGNQLRITQMPLEPEQISSVARNPDVAELTMRNGINLFANPISVEQPGSQLIQPDNIGPVLAELNRLIEQVENIRSSHLSPIHQRLADLERLQVSEDAPAWLRLTEQYLRYQQTVDELNDRISVFRLNVVDAQGRDASIPLADIQKITYPNRLSSIGKLWVSLGRIWMFISDEPKQANTAGGVFPALFGTILMVLLMTVIVTPFGVLAAIYLSEYAPNNAITTALRIGVSNMAGVPSIVYGVFGLGFFIYAIGGSIDSLFYSDDLPSPTFGAPGLFWASLTMALLTLPVVVVATEEGLQRVPKGIRSSSYALGATKLETIWYTVLPIASPGIMTGVILAIARAAGEVAPLMLVGAVKFAPTLPVDGEFPFLHLDRQFMHLGVFIFDGAFHSQTDSKGSSMMFAACLLLLLCVFVLNLIAINLRSRLRKRYAQG